MINHKCPNWTAYSVDESAQEISFEGPGDPGKRGPRCPQLIAMTTGCCRGQDPVRQAHDMLNWDSNDDQYKRNGEYMSCGTGKEGVNWFEIPVNDLDRARKFYEAVFGMPMSTQTMGKVQMALWPKSACSSGAGGSLVKAAGFTPSHQGTLIYFTVADIQAVLAKVIAEDGKMLKAKTNIGEYGFIAHFEDSEGNRVGLHQS